MNTTGKHSQKSSAIAFAAVMAAILTISISSGCTCSNSSSKKHCVALQSEKAVCQEIENWIAGSAVSDEQIFAYGGPDSLFRCLEIDSLLFARIDGKSYKKGCTIPLSDLRYLRLIHRDASGTAYLGEMICSAAIAQDLIEIFKELYLKGYPIEKMVLIDCYDADDEKSMEADNSSGFNFRPITGSTKLSAHSYGLAVDINPLYNPYVKLIKGTGEEKLIVEPANARPYIDRDKEFPYKIAEGDLCDSLFTAHGFVWGGRWKSLKDYQHFEKTEQ